MLVRYALWSALAVAFLLSLVACSAAARADVYGQDIVPGSHFHHGSWSFYGSDAVPTSSTLHNDFRTTYGWDGVPDTTHPHIEHRYNVLLIETLQQLTSAVEGSPKPVVRTRSRRIGRR